MSFQKFGSAAIALTILAACAPTQSLNTAPQMMAPTVDAQASMRELTAGIRQSYRVMFSYIDKNNNKLISVKSQDVV